MRNNGNDHNESKEPEESFLGHLGDAIRARRTDLFLSQEQLGLRAGFHRTYVTDIENGVRNISIFTLLKISRALHTLPSFYILASEKAMNIDVAKAPFN
jgi:transcriptional regulator with XRE-family HTH domain